MSADLDTSAPATATAPPAAASPAASTPPAAPTPNYAATPAPPAAPAAPATPEYKYAEDRGNWIPPHRMSRAAEERQAALAEAAVLRRQMAAITGVTPPDPQSAEREQLTAALRGINPRLDKILSMPDEDFDALMGFTQHIPNVTATLDRYWNTSIQSTLDAVGQQFQTLGIKVNMTDPDDAEFTRAALVHYIKADRSGKRAERFEAGDASVLTEFTKYFHGKFVGGPAAAATTSNARELEHQRRTLPQAGARTAVLPTTDAGAPKPQPATGTTADRRSLHSRARQSYLDRVGART